jgi:hypothetical protein
MLNRIATASKERRLNDLRPCPAGPKRHTPRRNAFQAERRNVIERED